MEVRMEAETPLNLIYRSLVLQQLQQVFHF